MRLFAIGRGIAAMLAVTSAIGLPCYTHALADSGGQMDPTFHIGFEFHDDVHQIAVQSDGRILASGSFTTYDGRTVPSIVRLLPDGNLDPSFHYRDLQFSGGGYTDIKLDLHQQLLVLGAFYRSDFSDVVRLIRLQTNGTIDTVFATQPTSDDHFTGLLVMPDGSVVVGGSFQRFKNVARNGIARIQPDGSLDTAYNPGIHFSNPSIDNFLGLPNGDVLVSSAGWIPRSDPNNGYLRLRPDGSLNPIFPYHPDALSTAPVLHWDGTVLFSSSAQAAALKVRDDGYQEPGFAMGSAPNGTVKLALSDGRILVYYRLTSDHANLVRLFADGSIDPTFTLDVTDGEIESIHESPDGAYLISGYFQFVNDELAPALARILTGDENIPSQIRFNGAHFGAINDEAAVHVPILRTGDATQSVEVQVATTTGGTAVAGSNYVPSRGTVKFQPGQRLGVFNVPLVAGEWGIEDRTIRLELTGSLTTQASSQAEIILRPKLGTIEFATNAFYISEGENVGGIDVVRTNGPMSEGTVTVVAVSDTATTNDYHFPPSSAFFLSGSGRGQASYSVIDDTRIQGSRQFRVALTNLPPGYQTGVIGTATVTILDDDLPGSPAEALDTGATRMWPTPDGGVLLSGDLTNVFGQLRPGVAKLDSEGRLTDMFANFPFHPTRILDVQTDGRMAIETVTNNYVSYFRFGAQRSSLIEIRNQSGALLGSFAGTNRTLGIGLLPNHGFIRASGRPQLPGQSGESVYSLSVHTDDGTMVTNYDTRLGPALPSFVDNAETPLVEFTFRTNGSGFLSGNVTLPLTSFTSVSLLLRFDENLKFDSKFATDFSPVDALPFSGENSIRSWALPGGKVLTAGDVPYFDGTSSMGLFRFSNTGNADPSFQDSRLSYLKPDSHYANCVAPMPDGRIVTVSRNTKGGQIVRLLPDGSLDPTFGTNAIARYTITSLAIVSDGRIVVSGQFNLFAGARRPHLAWLTPNGELLPDRPLLLDPATFQSDGSLRLSIQSRVAGTAIFESSPDLQTWQPVTNFPVPIGKREILVHPPFGDSLFYRARLTRSP